MAGVTRLGLYGGPRAALIAPVEPAERDLVLAGQAPTLAITVTVPEVDLRLVTLRGLQFLGYPPTISVTASEDHVIPPFAGDELQAVIAGKVPTVFRQDYVVPAIDDLVLAGQIPIVRQTWSASPPEVDLVLAGYIPVVPSAVFSGTTEFTEAEIEAGGAEIKVTITGDTFNLWGGFAAEDWLDVTVSDQAEANGWNAAIRDAWDFAINETAAATKGGLVATLTIASLADYSITLTEQVTFSFPGTLLTGGNQLEVPGVITITPAHKPDADALVLAGQIPVVRQTWSASPAIDDLVIAGQIPTVFRQDYVVPAIDDLVLAGQIPVIRQTWSASPAEVDLVLAGKIPKIPSGLNPDADSLVLAGQIPVIRQTWSASPAIDDLVIAGQIPTVFRQDYVVPAIDALALTGKIPVIRQTWSAAPAQDALVLAGKILTLFREDVVAPAQDALVLAGKIPTVQVSLVALPAQDALALTGKIPVLLTSSLVVPDVCALVLAGQAPAVPLADKIAEPLVGTLALSSESFIALSEPPHNIPVPNGALVFTSYQPQRGVGLFIRGHIPNLVYPQARPETANLALTALTPRIVDTTEQPELIESFVSPRGLTGYTAALAMGQEADESSMILTGYAPIGSVTSPIFYPAAGNLTFNPQVPERVHPESPELIPDTATLTLASQAPTVSIGLVATPSEAELRVHAFERDRGSGSASHTHDVLPNSAFLNDNSFDGLAFWPVNSQVGKYISNITDGTDRALILSNTQSQIHHTALTGGTDNDWDVGDIYLLWALLYSTAPIVGSTPKVSPGAETLSLTGGDVTIGRSITPPAIGRSLNGKAPTAQVGISHVAEPAAASLTLTGKTPFTLFGPVAATAEATLNLAGQAPVSVWTTDHLAVPPAAELRFPKVVFDDFNRADGGAWDGDTIWDFQTLLLDNWWTEPQIVSNQLLDNPASWSLSLTKAGGGDQFAEIEIVSQVPDPNYNVGFYLRLRVKTAPSWRDWEYYYCYFSADDTTIYATIARSESAVVTWWPDYAAPSTTGWPDGSKVRFSVEGARLKVELDLNDGNGWFTALDVLDTVTRFTGPSAYGVGIEVFPPAVQTDLVLDNFRAGPLHTLVPEVFTTTSGSTPAGALALSSQVPRLKTKRIKKPGARHRLINLTPRYCFKHGRSFNGD